MVSDSSRKEGAGYVCAWYPPTPASPPFGLFVCRLTVEDFAWRVPEKRSVQVKHRKAQNYEIMVLEETKKYFGMPAAPKISRISDDEINRDLALMKVPPQTRYSQFLLSIGDGADK
jgi:hypothetical protein